ncbi:hypothetical protein GCM10027446_25280 [Angustibacter peucedani]
MRHDAKTLLTAALLASTALLGTAACGSESDVQVGSSSTTSPGTPSSSATSEPGGRMTEGISQPVVLMRSGGIGGLQDRVEVRPDGTATITSKGKAPVERQLSEAELAAVVRAVKDADLAALGDGKTTPTRSDEMTYTITAEGQTYRTVETQAPDDVRPLLDALGTLLSAPAPTP